jgi:formate-nitrite transporter family protein
MLIGEEDHDDIVSPELTEKQQQEAEERTAISAVVVHEAIRHDGEEELNRPASALAWSGLAAGLSMGFSFVGQALIYASLPSVPWRRLLVALGYPVGFLIVILGRQQLFTENTLTPIIPLLTRRNLSALGRVRCSDRQHGRRSHLCLGSGKHADVPHGNTSRHVSACD